MALINEFDVKSLVTESTNTFSKTGVMTAHSSFDSHGTPWNLLAKYGVRANNIFVSFDKDFKLKKHASFGSKKAWYTHSFGGNDRCVVVIEQPMYMSFGKFMSSKIKKRSYYECFGWDKDAKNVLHIFDKETRKIHHIKLDEGFFFFHTINTFEKKGILYVDLIGYKDNDIINDFYMDNLPFNGMKKENHGSFVRLVIDVANNRAFLKKRNVSFELPSINKAKKGLQYRFAYGIHSSNRDKKMSDSILKYDVMEDSYVLWKEEDISPGEPIFVASPGSTSEDEGVLLVVCWDAKKLASFLVVLDAQTMKEISRAYVPRHIPLPLHGSFYPGVQR